MVIPRHMLELGVPDINLDEIVYKLTDKTPAPNSILLKTKHPTIKRRVYIAWLAHSFEALFDYMTIRLVVKFPSIFHPEKGNINVAAEGIELCKELIDYLEGKEELEDEEVIRYFSVIFYYFFQYFLGKDKASRHGKVLLSKIKDPEESKRQLMNRVEQCVVFLKRNWYRKNFVIIGRGVAALIPTTKNYHKPQREDQDDILHRIEEFLVYPHDDEQLLYARLSVSVRLILEYLIAADGNLTNEMIAKLEKKGIK
jgi:hypothetical protein